MASFPPAGVEVSELTKRYGTVTALDGVSFSAEPGEIFGLLGPNGAGKTTTLECLLGLRQPDGGRVRIGGVDALAEPGKSKTLTGAHLQSAALQDKLQVREAVALFARFYPDPTPTKALLARFGLAEKARATFDSLSTGQKQRLFLALAFVNRPTLVVLDEPTSGLDPQARRELHDLLGSLRQEGVTILLSTHDLAEAQLLCDHVALLNRGRVVAAGAPHQLISRASRPLRLFVRTSAPIPRERLLSLPGISGLEADARRGGWILSTRRAKETTAALLAGLDTAELQELELLPPTLEDVFLEFTSAAPPAAALVPGSDSTSARSSLP